ncbi:hypothetical protein TNCV_3563581 [Trichonephila clavipes]|nr:hypothetical protein TNCV_3563581 [Trichonephila clavipes]
MGTLNRYRAASPLVRLVEGEERNPILAIQFIMEHMMDLKTKNAQNGHHSDAVMHLSTNDMSYTLEILFLSVDVRGCPL